MSIVVAFGLVGPTPAEAVGGYTVTFDANYSGGGTATQTTTGATNLDANPFSRPCPYGFAGWNTAADGSGTNYADQASFPFTADTTLYAKWTQLATVTFESGYTGGGTAKQCAPTGSSTRLTSQPFSRPGYTFVGWSFLGISIADNQMWTFTGDATLYAVWDATVTFDANYPGGGTSTQVGHAAAQLNAVPFSRTCYSFDSWNTAANASGTSYANRATYSFASNLTLYAKWTQLATVVFHANYPGGGADTMQCNFTQGGFSGIFGGPLNPNPFTRAGYTFAGWDLNPAGNSGIRYADGASAMVFSGINELYAQWNVQVAFDGNGATGGTMSPQIATTATGLTANAFTRTGYYFAGWNTAADGSGTSYSDRASFPFAASATLYAQWSSSPVLTFEANYSGGGSATQSASGTATLTTNPFSRPGYAFAGWNTAANGSGTAYADGASFAFSANTTLYARWNAVVTFDANFTGGTTSTQNAAGPTALSPNGFSRPGWTFLRWTTAADGSGTQYSDGQQYSFATPTTLYAQWNVEVTMDPNYSGATPTVQAGYGTYWLSINPFTRPGYTFVRWSTAADGSGTSYGLNAPLTFTAPVTLYAQWDVNVTFNSNGATGSMAVQHASAPTALNGVGFTWGGHFFAGWNTAADGSGATYTDHDLYAFTTPLTLYAQWSNYPVAMFHPNYSDPTRLSQSQMGIGPLNANPFSRPGYYFGGWNTAADGSGTSYADGGTYAFTQSRVLYAQWSTDPFVTFQANNPSDPGAGARLQNAPGTMNLTPNSFARTGYVFAGWNTASDGSGTAYADGAAYSFAANLTLYAQWHARVTFDANHTGGGTTTQTAAPASTLDPNGFARSGYGFAGWNTASDGSGTAYVDGAVFPFSSPTTLYAQWNATVTFDANYPGGGTTTQTASRATPLTANGFTRTGYFFAGWNTAADGTGTLFADGASFPFAAAHTTLYAQWSAKPVVTFLANNTRYGGTGGTTTQSGMGPAPLDPNPFRMTDYSFLSWNTAVDGSGTSYADGAVFDFTANVTLYAQWRWSGQTITSNGQVIPVGRHDPVVTYTPPSVTVATREPVPDLQPKNPFTQLQNLPADQLAKYNELTEDLPHQDVSVGVPQTAFTNGTWTAQASAEALGQTVHMFMSSPAGLFGQVRTTITYSFAAKYDEKTTAYAVVHSTPTALAAIELGGGAAAEGSLSLPEALEPGVHQLNLEFPDAKSGSIETATMTWLAVSATGEFLGFYATRQAAEDALGSAGQVPAASAVAESPAAWIWAAGLLAVVAALIGGGVVVRRRRS